jgi:hypothetical protein
MNKLSKLRHSRKICQQIIFESSSSTSLLKMKKYLDQVLIKFHHSKCKRKKKKSGTTQNLHTAQTNLQVIKSLRFSNHLMKAEFLPVKSKNSKIEDQTLRGKNFKTKIKLSQTPLQRSLSMNLVRGFLVTSK